MNLDYKRAIHCSNNVAFECPNCMIKSNIRYTPLQISSGITTADSSNTHTSTFTLSDVGFEDGSSYFYGVFYPEDGAFLGGSIDSAAIAVNVYGMFIV